MSSTPKDTPAPRESCDQAIETELDIINARGLHARASAKFVKCASEFDAKITVRREDQTVLATSIMGLMMLAAGIGTKITVTATGAEAKEATEALSDLVKNKFGEAS